MLEITKKVRFAWEYIGPFRGAIVAGCLVMTKAMEVLPEKLKIHILNFIPNWRWQTWLIFALICLGAFLIEEAYYRSILSEAQKSGLTSAVTRSNTLPIIVLALILISVATYDIIHGWQIHHHAGTQVALVQTQAHTARTSANFTVTQAPTSTTETTAKSKPRHKAHVRSTPPQSTPLPMQEVDHGIINNAPNSGDQTVEDNRQYGARRPPPPIHIEQERQLDPVPQPPASSDPQINRQRMIARMSEGHMDEGNPGVGFTIVLDGNFYDPAFWIRCSAPCRVEDIRLEGSSQIVHLSFSDPTVVGFHFLYPRQMQSGTLIPVDVRSVDSTKIVVEVVSPYAPPLQ